MGGHDLMEHRKLEIGDWTVDFLFAEEGYDEELILTYLYYNEAPYDIMMDTMQLLRSGMNKGFTYSDPEFKYALVVVGPASSGAEFIDTLVHEIFHLAVAVALKEGASLKGEIPAYIAGDSARDLSDSICRLGCVPMSFQ
jgi:hypothetical protein